MSSNSLHDQLELSQSTGSSPSCMRPTPTWHMRRRRMATRCAENNHVDDGGWWLAVLVLVHPEGILTVSWTHCIICCHCAHEECEVSNLRMVSGCYKCCFKTVYRNVHGTELQGRDVVESLRHIVVLLESGEAMRGHELGLAVACYTVALVLVPPEVGSHSSQEAAF